MYSSDENIAGGGGPSLRRLGEADIGGNDEEEEAIARVTRRGGRRSSSEMLGEEQQKSFRTRERRPIVIDRMRSGTMEYVMCVGVCEVCVVEECMGGKVTWSIKRTDEAKVLCDGEEKKKEEELRREGVTYSPEGPGVCSFLKQVCSKSKLVEESYV